MKSEFAPIRGLDYHVRRHGDAGGTAPPVFLLHGWLDTSATWVEVAQGLLPGRMVLSPDWRGLGLSEWPQDGYWFPDYVADLDALVRHYVPEGQVDVVGHSMGGQAASLYAGVRPERVRRLVLLDSLFLPDMDASLAPKRFRRWLEELADLPRQKTYDSYEALAERVRKQHPQLSAERALFVARGWGQQGPDGRISLCADPKHRMHGPGLYRAAESIEIWRKVTAKTLFLDGGASPFRKAISEGELRRRRECFATRSEDAIDGIGHMVHFDAPAEVARRVRAFLD